MKLQELRNTLHSRFQDIKSLEYHVKHDRFVEAYIVSTPDEQAMILAEIESCFDGNYEVRNNALDTLKAWLKSKTYRDVSLRDLKEIARTAGIKRYSRYNKEDLVQEIKRRTNGQGIPNHGNLGIGVRNPDPFTGNRNLSIDDCIQETKVREG